MQQEELKVFDFILIDFSLDKKSGRLSYYWSIKNEKWSDA